MDPINYMLDVKNPIEEAIRGYTMGRNEIAQRQDMQIQQQNATMQQQAFADQQRALQAQRAAADKAVADAQAGQAELARLAGLGAAATADDYMKAWVANPAIRDDLNNLKTMITEPQSAALLQTTQNMYVTTATGDIEATRNILQTQLDAAMNSGDQTMVPAYRAALDQLNQNPEGAMAQLKTTSAMTLMGLKGPEYLKTINESIGLTPAKPTDAMRTQDAQLRAAGIVPKAEGGDGQYEAAMAQAGGVTPAKPAEAVSPIGKIAADVKAGLIPKSVLDSALKAEAVNAAGGLTLKDTMTEEARLRGEYTTRTQGLTDAERNFAIIQISAVDDTGAGDIALVTSFMKMLDPGSVVRETEFATAANTGGLVTKLSSLVSKIENGKFLSPAQRTEFQNLSKKYLDAAKTQEQRVKENYQAIVDNYGLNPVNVFGASAALASEAPEAFINNPTVKLLVEQSDGAVTAETIWNSMTAKERVEYGK